MYLDKFNIRLCADTIRWCSNLKAAPLVRWCCNINTVCLVRAKFSRKGPTAMELQVTAYRLKTLLKSPYEKQSVFLSHYCANRKIKIIIIDVYYGCDSTLQNYIPDAQGTWCQTERQEFVSHWKPSVTSHLRNLIA